MMNVSNRCMRNITIYHSPHADDIFMLYGLVSGAVTHPGYEFSHTSLDIEALNKCALRGESEITTASVHAYAYLSERYSIMRSGASMCGKNYGPCLVVKKRANRKYMPMQIAIPGELTSAALALKIFLAQQHLTADLIPMDTEKVQEAVMSGNVEGGVIIHEGQLSYDRNGLEAVADLGAWWWEKNKLPLPLRINIVRDDLGRDAIVASQDALKESILYSLANRDIARAYAMSHADGISDEEADAFIRRYVNERTIDLGEIGIKAINLFLHYGRQGGFIPQDFKVKFL